MKRTGVPLFLLAIASWAQIGTTSQDVKVAARLTTLRGRVLDPEGDPVPKAIVAAARAGALKVRGSFGDEQETDADGRFEFKELEPGGYWLRASLKTQELPTELRQTAKRTEPVPTYYPSAMNRGDAELIQLRAGTTIGDYDIRMRISAVHRLRGKVLDETGVPVQHAEVELLSSPGDRALAGLRLRIGSLQYFTNQQQLGLEAVVNTDKDGSFEFPSVHQGDWILRAKLESEDNPYELLTTNILRIMVSLQDIDDLELRFAPRLDLKIAVDWGANSNPAQDQMPPVMLFDQTGQFVRSIKGRSQFNLAPGRYHILALPVRAPGFYVAAVMLGSHDVRGEDVELTSSATLQVVYKPNGGVVRGTVVRGEGATVLLWAEGTAVPDVVPIVHAGNNGSFEFVNVPPGNYSVIAFNQITPQGAPSAFFRDQVVRGSRVSVTGGGVESVEISVSRWPE